MALAPSEAATLLNALQGRWKVVYSELDGQLTPVADWNGIILENSGNSFKVEKDGNVLHEGTFSFNIKVNPFEIVYIYSRSTPTYMGGPRAGIFQLEGDTLKTCMGAIGHPAPKSFNTFPDSECVLSIHQRTDDVGVLSVQGSSVSQTRAVSQW